jgi:hypothetical protein
VNVPDFELGARIEARSLRSRSAPDPLVDLEHVELERHEERVGLPPHLAPATDYADVVVEKRLRGRLSVEGDDSAP